MTDRTCDAPSCDLPVVALGLCLTHYNNQYAKKTRAQRRADWIASQGGACVRCGD